MKISLQWCAEFLASPPPADIGERLTARGLEVEAAAADGDDTVLDIGITPNRGDCLSHLGVAREVAAAYDIALKPPRAADNADADESLPARIDEGARAACPYYGCLLLRDVDCAKPSPAWLRARVERCGGRSISAAVDVTNYLMLAYGQPLHAFDADKLQGGIRVRYAAAGERLALLDESTATCAGDDLLIADDAGGVALGGVMGGLHSGVTAQTRNVLLEAAFFAPAAVRGRARRFGLSSEAAFRFERGVDPNLPPVALTQAAALIKKMCGGQIGKPVFAGAPPPPPPPLAVAAAQARKLLGVDLDAAAMARLLNALHLPAETDGETLTVRVPSWRFDLKREVDVIEEIARAWGYDRLPETLPRGARLFTPAAADEGGLSPARARRVLSARGFFEVITYSFVPAARQRDLAQTPPLPLQNPMSEEMAEMRATLFGGLLDRAAFNLRHRQERVFLFEIGKCFLPPAAAGDLPAQPLMLGGIACGRAQAAAWTADNRAADFYDVKGAVEAFFGDAAGLEFKPAEPAGLNPNRAAAIIFHGETVGRIGELHPAAAGDFKTPPLLFELDLDAVAALSPPPQLQVSPVSRFPLIWRDVALLADAGVNAGALLSSARRAAPMPPVIDVRLFDFYAIQGDNTADGKKSCGLRISMQGGDANLTGAEIDAVVARVADAVRRGCGVVLREEIMKQAEK